MKINKTIKSIIILMLSIAFSSHSQKEIESKPFGCYYKDHIYGSGAIIVVEDDDITIKCLEYSQPGIYKNAYKWEIIQIRPKNK